ncbi:MULTISPECIES: alpha/beta hydrolase [unclassified Rhizobium]|uniref:alpha/beta hydrolase n=1 Tax=unclassified Rhizobium TaxID=2613769 RepID=UPI00071345DA|nr:MULTISPECIES: alpha/beta hydrolase [unclassified Rhizobium]KQT04742.1 lipase [Rhizobium sp. Leaf386]KQT05109.1 lipase [Rhizobium sp. Leaf391]KQU02094.1 lipase [Rhizobium sp. Leaf453]
MTSQDLYLIRDFVPDFDAIAAEFAERSRQLSAKSKLIADIRYGVPGREVLDVILPDNLKVGAPLHVFVHGGYWRSGEKENYRLIATPVFAAGGIAAIVEYDLMPGQRLGVLVDQVRRSILWLQKHAAGFGADPHKITVSGHSAGAHLASFLAARAPGEAERASLPALQEMLLVSGIYDLSGIPDSFLREEVQMTSAEAAAWSPLTATQLPSPRRTIAFGAEETSPFQEQALALSMKLATNNSPAQLLSVPGLNHMSVVLDLADPFGHLGGRVVDMISRC